MPITARFQCGTIFVCVLLSSVILVVNAYVCPAKGADRLVDLKGQLGGQDFQSLDQLGGIVVRHATGGIHLVLSDNDISNITDTTFDNPIFRIVVRLDLSGNHISELGSGVLDQFKCVRHLDVSFNGLRRISSDALRNLHRLKRLNLSNNSLISLSSRLFRNNHELSVLKVSNNDISKIGDGTFHGGLRDITEVDLSYNNLTSFEPWPYIPRLSKKHQLKFFDLKYNRISNFSNTIGWTIDPSEDVKTEYFLKIDLQFNQLRYFNIDQFRQYTDGRKPTAYDIGNLGLRLQNNPWYCDCGLYDVTVLLKNSFFGTAGSREITCEGPPDLKGKVLGYFYSNLDKLVCEVNSGCPVGCKCEDRPYYGHVVVNCSRSGFTDLPDVAPSGDLFLTMAGNQLVTLSDRNYVGNITRLDVSSNRIKTVPNPFITKANRLKYVDLRNNSMVTLPAGIETFPLTSIVFTGNPLVCSCDSLWLNDWVRRYSQNMSSEDMARLVCRHDDHYYRIVDVTYQSLVCYLDIAIAVSVALALLLVLLVILTLVCCCYKYECKVLLFEHFRLHPFDQVPCDKADDITKVYDVYISIHRDNEGMRIWVKDKLLKRLERRTRSHLDYKVYYPCRQDDFGDSIADQMVDNINRSRRVLAVINASYLKSGWSIEEFDHAHRLMEQAKSGRLLVLLYGDLDLSQVTQEPLRTYLTQRQCYRLTDKWVWRKIRYELPYRPNISKLRSASRESLASGLSSIHATLSESSILSRPDDTDYINTRVLR